MENEVQETQRWRGSKRCLPSLEGHIRHANMWAGRAEGEADNMLKAARRALAMGLCVAFAAIAMGGVATAETPSPTQLQEAVVNWASEIGAPGMTAQIVDTDGVLGAASTGIDGNGDPVDDGSPFVWGSVSKQLTAATVLGLEQEGVIDAEAPVVAIVPQASGMLADPATTVDDLVHHTSGLPHDLSVTDDWTRRESAAELAGSLPQPAGVSERGEFRYSSLNYLLLQAVVEESTGGSFADALESEVLGPADATDTITDPTQYTEDVPPGHVPFFGSAKPIDVGVDSAGLGYGYLAGSIEELGRYASWRLGELQDGEASMPAVDTGQGTEYGAGLFHENIDGQEVWWHSGAVPGYYTYVAFVPGENTAIVLATNKYGEIEAERIAAVGRNLTTLVLDGSTTALPSSLALPALGILLGLVAVLVAVIAWVITGLFTGKTRERSLVGAGVRIAIAALVGGAVLFGAFIGVPSLVGASLSVMWLWAPDVTLVFWVLLGTVFLATALVVANEVVNYKRFRMD